MPGLRSQEGRPSEEDDLSTDLGVGRVKAIHTKTSIKIRLIPLWIGTNIWYKSGFLILHFEFDRNYKHTFST